jgi:hypothetical protein
MKKYDLKQDINYRGSRPLIRVQRARYFSMTSADSLIAPM